MIKVYQLTALQNNFIVMIPFKGCQVEAKFEKGNVSKGVHARLYTNDKFIQRAVESSDMYGKMYKLVESVPEPEDELPKQPKVKPQEPDPAPQHPEAPQQPEGNEGEGEQGAPADDDNGKMVFANLADAIMYIAQQWQIAVSTEAEARQVLKDHDILPVIKRG